MISVTTADLLAAWERGLSQSASRRLLALLTAAYSELSEEQLLELPIGRRDSLALRLREVLFGSSLTSLAICPVCTERLEFALDVSDIRITSNRAMQNPLVLTLNEFELEFRLPNSRDLMYVEASNNVDEARKALLERCLLSVSCDGQRCTVHNLPEAVLEQVEAAMAEADPQAEVQLDLSCPACKHSWLATFDIASFLWSEINAWAQRILNEVHLLAKAYAWREADILAMSPIRRRFYLERVMQ
jgi:hypothetical protein